MHQGRRRTWELDKGNVTMKLLLLLLSVLSVSLAHPTLTRGSSVSGSRDGATRMIAKPTTVPFTGTRGSILVHLTSASMEECLGRCSVEVHTGMGRVIGKSAISSAKALVVDRNGRRWLHVPVDLTPLPSGASKLTAILNAGSGEPLESCEFKVVRGTSARHGIVSVDNVHGRVMGRDGEPFFPFGSYTRGVLTESERTVPETEAQFGMSWIAPYLSESGGHSNETWNTILEFLDRCHEMGVRVHYDLHRLAMLPVSTEKYELMKTEVTMVMDHPAVSAYYLADEPGSRKHEVDPQVMENAYDHVKTIDPNKPCSMVFCCSNPESYIHSFDIGMADPYPIPVRPPEFVVTKTAEMAATGKPFFMALQAFGGSGEWERTPTPAEERVMTYLSVLTGATGIQYFIRSPHNGPYAPTAWSECRRVSLEIRELSSAILSGKPQVKVQSSVSTGVMGAGWEERLEGVYTVAAVNYLQKPVNVTLATNTSYTGPATVLFENREVSVKNGSITDILMAYGTGAYRFPPIKSTMVSPSNLLKNPSFEQVTSASSPDGAYLNVPSDPGSSYLTDTSVSVDGLHSLRLVTPTANGGFIVSPYPVSIQANTSYEFSFWAKSSPPALTVQLRFRELTPTSSSVHTTAEWSRYAVNLTGQTTAKANPVTYQLVDNGTVWIDLMQLIPKN